MRKTIAVLLVCASSSLACAESLPEFDARMAQGQFCYMRRADQVSGQAEVKAEIDRKAQAEGRTLREYTCRLVPKSETDKTLYYHCETSLGLCYRNAAVAASHEGLMRAFTGMREAQAANGEGYHTERPSGRRYWCDNAFGCQPR